MRDLYHNIQASQAIAPQTVNASAVNSSIINMAGFNSVVFTVSAGAITDGSYAVTLTVGNQANLSDGIAADPIYILGTLPAFTTANANATLRFGYNGNFQYLQLTLTPTGTTHGGLFSATAIQGHPAFLPIA